MKLRSFLFSGVLGVFLLPSCAPVSQSDLARLSKPGLQFQERGAFGMQCSIVSQMESGKITGSVSGGGGGC